MGSLDLGGTEYSFDRRGFMKRAAGACALAAAPSVLSACGSSSSSASGIEALRESGVRLGIAEVLPAAGLEDGSAVGVFPEVAEMVMEGLGVESFEPVLGDFPSAIPSLQADRTDIACTGMYMTADRCETVLFSDPILCFSEAFGVQAGNPLDLRTYEDIAESGARLAVITASFEFDLAKEAGVEDSQISKYGDVVAMFDALNSDRVDAVGYDDHTISYFVDLPEFSQFDTTQAYAPAGISCGALAFREQDTELRDLFNEEQKKLSAEGAFDEIFERWAAPARNVKLAEGETAEKICAEAV